jgi:hypothetical protein
MSDQDPTPTPSPTPTPTPPPPPPPPPNDPPPPPPLQSAEINRPMINALFCAVNILKGTEGGFSPHERSSAADVLEVELLRLEDAD